MKKIHIYALSALTLLSLASCERLSVDEQTSEPPFISAFTPVKAPVGSEIVITGENLNNVSAAYIGDVQVEIRTKVSDKLMSIMVGSDVTSGKIVLVNPVGKGSSEDVFECSFAVPEIINSLVQSSAELGETILLTGSSLNSAKSVVFTAKGETAGHTAEIVTRSDEELVVKVPYVENGEAVITLTYYDGTEVVQTDSATAPRITVIRKVPTFSPVVFERTAVGKSLTLSGENLNNVEKVTVGGFEAQIASKSANSITFTIPSGDFSDGETVVELKAEYFEGNETLVLDDAFTVYVPFVRYWENIVLECQSQDAVNGTFTSFFSPENGRAYANSLWATTLDPLAMSLQGSQFKAANQFKEGTVTEEQYNAVLPYFFFSVVSQKDIQINSPANSNSQLKNFLNDSNISSTNRVPGNNSSPASGTPILAFRCLSAGNATEADIISKVVSGSLENIDEASFPVDETAMTIGGVGFISAAGGGKSSNQKWPSVTAPDPMVNSTLDLSGADVVLMVAYYSCNGFNADNKVQNIKRIGFVHITKIDYILSAGDLRGSQITFNCYWQKYDYDYSKL